jgi:hypothetical protein
VIRFSAALVAVAIGVLIGGIATSKLLLVYIAIVVSAVALVALAVGVVLKREELFGEGQGLAPAGAGASPVLSARAGESHGKTPPSAHGAPSPSFPATAGGYGAAFGGIASAPSLSVAGDLPAARQAVAGPGRPAGPVPPWATSAARDPWSSSTPDWMPAGEDERAASGVGSAGSRAPSAWPDASQGRTPGNRVSGWDLPDASAQAAATAPQSWAGPASSAVSSDAPAVKPGAGSGSAPPSWFGRLNQAVGADAPATTSTSAPGSGSGWPGPSREGNAPPADTTVTGDEDDDWPTRYSWLDDEADETVAADGADAALESKSPAPDGTGNDAGSGDIAPPKASAPGARVLAGAAPGDQPAQPAAATAAVATVAGTSGDAETRDTETADAATQGGAASEPAGAAGEADAGVAAFAGPDDSDELSLTSDPDPKARLASETGSEPPAAPAAGAAPGTALVAVVRGVPRYHEPDCVLIRFMSEGDVQKLTVPQAREEGCTPCTACQSVE